MVFKRGGGGNIIVEGNKKNEKINSATAIYGRPEVNATGTLC